MEYVDAIKLSNLRMAAGNEDKYSIVIRDGYVIKWVGIGWTNVRLATQDDIEKYPNVRHTQE